MKELLGRSALETEKLELLTEVSSLKLKVAAAEGDHRESAVTNVIHTITTTNVPGAQSYTSNKLLPPIISKVLYMQNRSY